MSFRLLALALTLTLPATGPARAVAGEEKIQPAPPTDPNEKICENVTQIGSRIAKKRVCATRAEWAQRRLQDRQDAEKIQRSITGSTCTTVRTNGSSTC